MNFMTLQNPNDNLVVRFFQLALSLRNLALDPDNGMCLLNILGTMSGSQLTNILYLFVRDVAFSLPEISPCIINWHVDVCS